MELISWKQNTHREDQCILSIAGAYPVMFLQVVSTWGTTPFRHHLQKGFLPGAEEQYLQWQHLCFPRSWTQCYISETRGGLWLKMSILAPNLELTFWLKLSYSLFSPQQLIRNWIEQTLIGNYELSSNLYSCREEEWTFSESKIKLGLILSQVHNSLLFCLSA